MVYVTEAEMKRIRAIAAGKKSKRKEKAKAIWPKQYNRKLRIKFLKTDGHTRWSLHVRNRDGNKCIMCGSVQNLNAHHWLFRKAHSVRLALDPANGATLCAYPCHLGRVHHDGDGDFILQLADKMIAIVTPEKVAEMRETAKRRDSVTVEELEALYAKL